MRLGLRFISAPETRAALLLTLCLMSGCRFVSTPDATTDGRPALQVEIESMLDASATAWNEGRLEDFMQTYFKSAGTTYIGDGGLVSGHEAITRRYERLFEPGASRDSLRFEAVRTRQLGPLYSVATARWILHSEGIVTGSGPFTLVLRRVEGGWKIIHDHASSDPSPESEEA